MTWLTCSSLNIEQQLYSSVSILFTWYLVCLIKSEFILQIAWSTAGVTPAGTICVCVCGVNPCLSVYVCMCVFVCKRVLAVRPQQYWYCWDRRWAGRFIFGSVTVCQWLQMRRKGKLLDTSKPWSVSLLSFLFRSLSVSVLVPCLHQPWCFISSMRLQFCCGSPA